LHWYQYRGKNCPNLVASTKAQTSNLADVVYWPDYSKQLCSAFQEGMRTPTAQSTTFVRNPVNAFMPKFEAPETRESLKAYLHD